MPTNLKIYTCLSSPKANPCRSCPNFGLGAARQNHHGAAFRQYYGSCKKFHKYRCSRLRYRNKRSLRHNSRMDFRRPPCAKCSKVVIQKRRHTYLRHVVKGKENEGEKYRNYFDCSDFLSTHSFTPYACHAARTKEGILKPYCH